ncbi:sulfatase [Pendulispora rubella]|uniref:Sulfatase n=1 Tax=Pendulispora rubella TaxID=2741070 RepID=A0ABZ2L7T4_9BACT
MTERRSRLLVVMAVLIGGIAGGAACILALWLWDLLPLRKPVAVQVRPPDASRVDVTPPAPQPAQPVEIVPEKRAFNVVLLTIDTLRFDLGFMGYPRPITPNIDALAARSTVYERAYATASYTPKSLGPLLIGRYASETFRDPEHYTTFFPKNVFLAERLHDADVRTFAGMCHHYFKWDTGYRQGFDVWDTAAMPKGMTDNDTSITGERLTARALALLGDPANVGRRFFAWFHYFDPHAPYVAHAGAPSFGKKGPPTKRTLYDQEIWFTDQQIGRVLDFIAKQPWGAETAIVLTADHGEAFGEHGHLMHGRELWEAIVRVPLIIYVPGGKPRRIAVKRSQIDLVPTVLELAGAPPPTDGLLRGKSLLADMAEGDTAIEERDVYLDMPEGPFNEMRRAIITGPSPGMKLIDLGDHRYELYDLRVDPDEKKDLVLNKERFRASLTSLQRLRAQLQEIRATR